MASSAKRAAAPPNGCSHQIILNLPPAQHKALLLWKRKRLRKSANVANAGYWILCLALDHPKAISAWMDHVHHYCEAEDIPQHDYINASIARHPEYKRAKIKPTT